MACRRGPDFVGAIAPDPSLDRDSRVSLCDLNLEPVALVPCAHTLSPRCLLPCCVFDDFGEVFVSYEECLQYYGCIFFHLHGLSGRAYFFRVEMLVGKIVGGVQKAGKSHHCQGKLDLDSLPCFGRR